MSTNESSNIVQRLWNYCNVLCVERWLWVVGEIERELNLALVRAEMLRGQC